jgi:nitroreductase
MNTVQAIHTRRSIRKYQKIPLSDDIIRTLLDSIAASPSSGNLQNWKVIVVTKSQTKESLASACFEQQWIAHAPALVVICSDQKAAVQFYGKRGEMLYSIQNCAAATQNVLLTATHMGLGSCWISSFDEQAIKDILKIPDSIRPQSIVTVGFADEIVSAPPKKSPREYLYFEEYAKRLELQSSLSEVNNYGEANVLFVQKIRAYIKGITHWFKEIVTDLKQKAFK